MSDDNREPISRRVLLKFAAITGIGLSATGQASAGNHNEQEDNPSSSSSSSSSQTKKWPINVDAQGHDLLDLGHLDVQSVATGSLDAQSITTESFDAQSVATGSLDAQSITTGRFDAQSVATTELHNVKYIDADDDPHPVLDEISAGDVVYMLPGEHELTSEVPIPSNVTLWLDKDATIRGDPGGENAFFTLEPGINNSLENITFRGGTIDASDKTVTGSSGDNRFKEGIIRSNNGTLSDIEIRDVTFETAGNQEYLTAIEFLPLGGAINNRIISDLQVIGCRFNQPNDSCYGLNLYDGRDVWVHGNYLDLAGSGAFNPIALYGDTEGFRVSDNIIENGGHSGIACSTAHDGVIANNLVQNIGTGGEGGIEIEYKNRTHSTQDPSSNVVVANNIVKNCNWGIFTKDRGSGNLIEDVTIRGNQVTGADEAAILLEDADRVKVEGNHIPHVPGGQRGIECRVDAADIADNTVLDNAGVGINVTGAEAHIEGNRVEGGTTAIAVQFGGTEASIVANRVVSSGTQAIYLDSNCEECFVSVNDLDGNPSVNNQGTNTTIENNNHR